MGFATFRKLLTLALLPAAWAATAHYELDIGNTDIKPDGFPRSAITVNGIFPGTVITANKGDDMEIVVKNSLTDPSMRRSTSIHWHGLFQARTSAMDGPAFVTQCPIAPNATFTQGTFWYHSHLSTQYCDGLRGALVIYDPDDPLKDMYDVDDESTIITLADWYHTVAPDAQDQFFKSHNVPIPDSGLINGVGRFVGGDKVPYAVINVEHGRRYRLRIISISCRPFYTFSIDGHNMTVIELDGTEHDPVEVQNADIYAAQRISVVLTANQPVGNYWIRSVAGGPTGNPNLDVNLTKAILRYKGANDEEPTTPIGSGKKLDDAEMHPIAQVGPGGLDGPAHSIQLNIAQPNPPFFDINNISYISPTVPVLLQILSGAKNPEDFFPSEQVFTIPPNTIIEVFIPGGGQHPFHRDHGHTFDIVRTSGSTNVNLVNPPRRDVVPVTGGNTTFRFFSGNPGAWFLHCHIDWHLEAGLAIVFGESPVDNISGPQSQIVPQEWSDLCPDYDALPPEFQ
ncbi:laccase 6 [Amylostereum chailletii]|nr:laccase 6 [Amylostereum chailletii]